jgi:hypothetical protein
MRRAVILIVAVFAIALVLAVLMGQSLVVGQRLAHVSGLAGEVSAKLPRGGDFQPLADGMNVLAGTTIRTGPAATVTLNWIDGTRIRVGSNAIMTVLKCQINRNTQAETSLFRLQVGEILVRVRKLLSGESKFEIRTPTATAGVRGTIFAVRVGSGGQTEIEVIEGRVKVDAQGRELDLAAGTKATASPRTAEVHSLSTQDQAAWEREKGELGPYLLVTEPAAGATVQPGTVEVKGQVERGAQVSVQGKPVEVNDLNRFVASVGIPAASKHVSVTVVARDERGYETREVRQLTVAQ